MFKYFLLTGCCLGLIASCSGGDGANGDFRRAALVSSKGETLYVKSYCWGLTQGSQISTVADTDDPIGWDDQKRPSMVKGQDPFLYRFTNDTLTLYAETALPAFAIRCPSITVNYQLVDATRYRGLHYRAVDKQLELLLGQPTYHRPFE